MKRAEYMRSYMRSYMKIRRDIERNSLVQADRTQAVEENEEGEEEEEVEDDEEEEEKEEEEEEEDEGDNEGDQVYEDFRNGIPTLTMELREVMPELSIQHYKIDAILKVLKKYHPELPQTARALLQTDGRDLLKRAVEGSSLENTEKRKIKKPRKYVDTTGSEKETSPQPTFEVDSDEEPEMPKFPRSPPPSHSYLDSNDENVELTPPPQNSNGRTLISSQSSRKSLKSLVENFQTSNQTSPSPTQTPSGRFAGCRKKSLQSKESTLGVSPYVTEKPLSGNSVGRDVMRKRDRDGELMSKMNEFIVEMQTTQKRLIISIDRMNDEIRALRSSQKKDVDWSFADEFKASNTAEELITMNEKLEDSDSMRSTKNMLTMHIRTSVGGTVRAILRRFGTNEAWAEFSYAGQRGDKKPFLKLTKIHALLLAIIKENDQTATAQQINSHVKEFLKRCGKISVKVIGAN